MIPVNRSAAQSPLNPQLVATAQKRLYEFYSQPADIRSKQKLASDERIAINRQARDALLTIFRNKCGYCESELGVASPGEVDPFRPFTDASDLSGLGSPDHYGWLSVEWENLYIACPACARAKRSLFPVQGERASVLTTLNIVRETEEALLVDPCFDKPSDHLKFAETGVVEALSMKGEVTIKVLNLNREGLVRARRDVWTLALSTTQAQFDQTAELSLIPDERPYAATARAAVQAVWDAHRPNASQSAQIATARPVPREVRSAEQVLAHDAEAFRLTARPLKQVDIVNFRALRDLSLKFGEPGSERAPWLMLLGENATGKSTVLQAIALALAGADEARRHVRPSRLLSSGAFAGSIRIWFWDQDTPVELHFNRSGSDFEGTRGPSAIVLAYGALRYAERRPRGIDRSRRFSRIAPILQPIARVPYPGSWLLGLDKNQFDTAARALQSVLPVSSEAFMERTANRIYFDVGDHRASLSELSAGYQTVVGMCADIMRHLFERWIRSQVRPVSS